MLVKDTKNGMKYEDMPLKQSRKQDLMVVSEMSSFKILNYLAHRHRVGLLIFTNFVLVSYLAWDKVLHIFL